MPEISGLHLSWIWYETRGTIVVWELLFGVHTGILLSSFSSCCVQLARSFARYLDTLLCFLFVFSMVLVANFRKIKTPFLVIGLCAEPRTKFALQMFWLCRSFLSRRVIHCLRSCLVWRLWYSFLLVPASRQRLHFSDCKNNLGLFICCIHFTRLYDFHTICVSRSLYLCIVHVNVMLHASSSSCLPWNSSILFVVLVAALHIEISVIWSHLLDLVKEMQIRDKGSL